MSSARASLSCCRTALASPMSPRLIGNTQPALRGSTSIWIVDARERLIGNLATQRGNGQDRRGRTRSAREAAIHLRHACRRLLIARHHNFDLVLLVIQCFKDTPSVSTGNAKNMVNTRFLQHFYDAVNGLHSVFSPGLVLPLTLPLSQGERRQISRTSDHSTRLDCKT